MVTTMSLPPAARHATAAPVGHQLRQWRQHRRLSQLALALEADISTRHLSCLETGRAQPSRDMLLRLAEHLEVPLAERNALLQAAGFAPLFRERPWDADEMQPVRVAVGHILHGQAPNPAVLVDRHWQLLEANKPALAWLGGVDAALLQPPLNVLRLSLHPRGLAPRIHNLAVWRSHLLARLRLQLRHSADAALAALHDELTALPAGLDGATGVSAAAGTGAPDAPASAAELLAVPLVWRADDGALEHYYSTTTVFGTAVDLTLAGLALESFVPADAETARRLRQRAGASQKV